MLTNGSKNVLTTLVTKLIEQAPAIVVLLYIVINQQQRIDYLVELISRCSCK